MTGLIILILIGLGGLIYFVILFLGVVGVTIGGLTKKKPSKLTKDSERIFLNSARTESDYESDDDFLKFLPPNSSLYSLKEKTKGYYDSIRRRFIPGSEIEKEINVVIKTIYCPSDCHAVRTLIYKMIENNHSIYSAMLREEKAAQEWMRKNNKCYYPVSYMMRTFKKYGIAEKLNELRKLGCSVPNDFRPYAPGRESNELWIVMEKELQCEREKIDYKESKAQAAEGLWLILSIIILVIGIALAVLLYNIMEEGSLRNFIVILLPTCAGFGALYCTVRAPGAGIKARRDESEDIKDDIYPGL